MKFFRALIVTAASLVFGSIYVLTPPSVLAADSSPLNQSLQDARQQMERVREQVTAGLLPVSKLADAQTALDDAMDKEVLDQTLYGHVDIQNLTEAQSGEMVTAAQRRVDRAQAEVDRAEH